MNEPIKRDENLHSVHDAGQNALSLRENLLGSSACNNIYKPAAY